METKTCPYCRTVNEGHAIVCVNCSARIGEPPQPTAGADDSASGSLPPANADDASGWGAPPPPPPAGTVAPPGVAMPSSTSSLPPSQPKRSNTMLLLAIAAAVLVVGAGLVLFLSRSGGGGLPEELNGHPRADSEFASELENVFDAFEIAGISFEAGLYGESEPVAMMMLIDGLPGEVTDVPSDAFFQSFAASFAQQGGIGFDLTNPVQASSGGADFICVDAPAEAFGGGGFGSLGAAQDGSFCVFKGETVGMIFLFDGTAAPAAMVAAQSAYGEVA